MDFFDFSQSCHSVCHKITFCDRNLSHLPEKVTKTVVLWNVYGVFTRISSAFKMVQTYHIFVCGCIVAVNMFIILYKYHCFVQFCQIIYRFFWGLPPELSHVTNGKYVLLKLGSTYLPYSISSGVIRWNTTICTFIPTNLFRHYDVDFLQVPLGRMRNRETTFRMTISIKL